MKKRGLKFLVVPIFAFAFLITNVKADFEYGGSALKCQNVLDSSGKEVQKCELGFTITGNTQYLSKIGITLNLVNVTFDNSHYDLSNNFILSSISTNSIQIESKQNAFALGYHKIGDFYFYKIESAKECYISPMMKPVFENRSCQITNGKYYDKEGNETTEINYKKECEPNKCVAYSDGTYTNKNGEFVDKETYENECFEKKYCTIENGKYFGKEGIEVTQLDYQKECERHYCEILSDGTYYGKDGSIVTKQTYEDDCLEKYICTINDGKYYGKDGNETTKLNYQKECEKHSCEILDDGTRYDKEGNITDEATYKKQCEIHRCEIVDDKYYNKEGIEITEARYNLECKTHTCEKIENTYFDDKGNIVDEKTYNQLCLVENPTTGKLLPITYVVIATIIASILFYVSRKYKKFN